MGRLQPETSLTIPSDSDHREETLPVNQPPLAPPPQEVPAVTVAEHDVPDSPSLPLSTRDEIQQLPDTPPTVPSNHHEETLPGNEPPLAPPPAVAVVTTEIADADVTDSPPPPLSTDPTRHHAEIQQLQDTPPAPQPPQLPQRHDTDDVDLLHAVSFPPQPHSQSVPYRAPEQFPPPGGSGGNVQPPPATASANGQFEVYKPPVGANGSIKEQPRAPRVMIVPFIGEPWTSGLFDCCQHPRNGTLH